MADAAQDADNESVSKPSDPRLSMAESMSPRAFPREPPTSPAISDKDPTFINDP
jgi:hypothetical protein